MNKVIYLIGILCISVNTDGLKSQTTDGIELVNFEPSECLEEDMLEYLQNRIVSITNEGKETVIEIVVVANCCIGLYGNVSLSNDTVYLGYRGEEYFKINEKGDTTGYITEFCECNCCFRFKYQITGLGKQNYIYVANDVVLTETTHKYKIRQQESYLIESVDTINFIDIYGFKQGLHKSLDDKGRIKSALYFRDNTPESGLLWRRFYEEGTLKRELYLLENKNYETKEYFPSGALKKECIQTGIVDGIVECKEYDEGSGEQIFKIPGY